MTDDRGIDMEQVVPVPDAELFTVTMLGVLRADFEQWLQARGLMVAEIPDPGIMHRLIVVPIAFHERRSTPTRNIPPGQRSEG